MGKILTDIMGWWTEWYDMPFIGCNGMFLYFLRTQWDNGHINGMTFFTVLGGHNGIPDIMEMIICICLPTYWNGGHNGSCRHNGM